MHALDVRQDGIVGAVSPRGKQILAGNRRNEEVAFFGAQSAALVAIHTGRIRPGRYHPTRFTGSL
jgi:hypothetical protein